MNIGVLLRKYGVIIIFISIFLYINYFIYISDFILFTVSIFVIAVFCPSVNTIMCNHLPTCHTNRMFSVIFLTSQFTENIYYPF
jgi:hypothetical protein